MFGRRARACTSAVAFLAVVLLAVIMYEFSDSTAGRALAAAPPAERLCCDD